jgi:hypothetical protein
MPDQQSLFPSAEESLAALRAAFGRPAAPAPERARKPADDVWDALAACVGWQPEPKDVAAARLFGKVVADLVRLGATPQQMRERASKYRATYPGAALTPTALVKHWSAMAAPTNPPAFAGTAPGRSWDDEMVVERDGERMTIAQFKERMAQAEDAGASSSDLERLAGVLRDFGRMPGT